MSRRRPPIRALFAYKRRNHLSRLTVVIDNIQYPAYKSYQALVGQFAPQVTVFKGIISLLLGTRTRLAEELGWVGSRDVKGKKVQ